jgi:fluoride exporter
VTLLSVSIGAVLGANLRFLVGGWVAALVPTTFPLGTLVVNVTGSLLLGLVLTLVGERAVPGAWWRTGVAVGLLGSYTTFSSFSYETVQLVGDGALAAAALDVIVSVGGALVGTYLGIVLGRAL